MIRIQTSKLRAALEERKQRLLLATEFVLRAGEAAGLAYLQRTTRFRNRTGNLRRSFGNLGETVSTRTFGVTNTIQVAKGLTPFEYGRFVDARVQFMAMASEHAFVAMHRAMERRLRQALGT